MEREAFSLAMDGLGRILNTFEKEGKFVRSSMIRNELFDEIHLLLVQAKKALAQPAQEPRDIAKIVEGMEVSIDVSTGEHDSGNRLFGTVTLAQENQSSKHGLILLVQEPEPNFKTTTPPQREWVGLTEQERNNIENDFSVVISIHVFDAIEAKLKKNNETTN